MLGGAPVKWWVALAFQVQKGQVGNRYIGGIVALMVLMVAGALGVKAKFMLGDVCDFALAAFALVACVHYLEKKMPSARWRYLAPNQRCILAVRGGHLNQRRALWLEPSQASLPSSVVAR